jgi:hypothetical protein
VELSTALRNSNLRCSSQKGLLYLSAIAHFQGKYHTSLWIAIAFFLWDFGDDTFIETKRIEFKIQTKTKGEQIMRNIIQNISLKRLSWLAALPVTLAAFGASITPAQAGEHHHKDTVEYSSYTPKYSYCSLWEHRHEYRCTGYYQPRYERHHSRYDKWDYRYHRKDNHNRDRHSDWRK